MLKNYLKFALAVVAIIVASKLVTDWITGMLGTTPVDNGLYITIMLGILAMYFISQGGKKPDQEKDSDSPD